MPGHLANVADRVWVVQQCLSHTAKDFSTQQALLQYGLQLTAEHCQMSDLTACIQGKSVIAEAPSREGGGAEALIMDCMNRTYQAYSSISLQPCCLLPGQCVIQPPPVPFPPSPLPGGADRCSCGAAGAGEVDIHAEPAPWWLLQRVFLLEQLDALSTFMALIDRSATSTTPAAALLLCPFVCCHWFPFCMCAGCCLHRGV